MGKKWHSYQMNEINASSAIFVSTTEHKNFVSQITTGLDLRHLSGLFIIDNMA